MIADEHPIITALSASDLEFIPVGSRYIGYYDKRSDYDFILPVKSFFKEQEKKLVEMGLERVEGIEYGYGKDPRLCAMFRYPAQGHLAVEVFVFEEKEARERQATFKVLKQMYEAYSCHNNAVTELCTSLKGKSAGWYALHQLIKKTSEKRLEDYQKKSSS